MSEYDTWSVVKLKRQIQTIEVGLAVMEKFPEKDQRDPRYDQRKSEYQKKLEEMRAALHEKTKGDPVVIQAKTVSLGFSQRKG